MNSKFFEYLLTCKILVANEELLNNCKSAQDYSPIAVEILNLDYINTPGFELDFFEMFPNLKFVRISKIYTKGFYGKRYQYNPDFVTKVCFIPVETANLRLCVI